MRTEWEREVEQHRFTFEGALLQLGHHVLDDHLETLTSAEKAVALLHFQGSGQGSWQNVDAVHEAAHLREVGGDVSDEWALRTLHAPWTADYPRPLPGHPVPDEPTPTAADRAPGLVAGRTRVITSDGVVVLDFGPDGVCVRLACDTAVIPWSDWEHIAAVYGKRRRRGVSADPA